MNRLYGIKNRWRNYEIIEFEIIKETLKQYKIKEICNVCWKYEYTINKDKMKNESYIFETTFEKAQLKRKEQIQIEIQSNKRKIEDYKKRVADLEKLLLE